MDNQKLLDIISQLTNENMTLKSEVADLTAKSLSLHQIIYGSKSKLLEISTDLKEYQSALEISNELTKSSFVIPSITECMETLVEVLEVNYGIKHVTAYFRNLGGKYTEDTPLKTYFNTEIGDSGENGKAIISEMYSARKGNLTKCSYRQLRELGPGTTIAYTLITTNHVEPVCGLVLECDTPLSMSQASGLQTMVETYSTVIQLKKKWLESRLISNAVMSKYSKEVETSRIDTNTRILNKLALEEYSKQYYDKKPTIIAFLDLDDFKTVNDKFGHDSGDEVLLWFATALHSEAKLIGGDVFRDGGDEFLAVFTCGDLELVMNTMSVLLDTVRNKVFQFTEHNVGKVDDVVRAVVPHKITCSIGVFHNKDILPFEKAKKLADHEMYRAKEEGKNRITLLTEVELDE